MDNLSQANIQSSIQRAQLEGGMQSAQMFGASVTGKADEEKQQFLEPEEKIDLRGEEKHTTEGSSDTLSVNEGEASKDEKDCVATHEDPSREEIMGKGVEIPEDSLKTAEVIVRQQLKDPAKSAEASKVKPLGEPKLLDLRMAESVRMMDIHDLMTGKPLPPVIDEFPDGEREEK